MCVFQQIGFVFCRAIKVDAVEVIDGGTQTNTARDIGRSRFKFVGQISVRDIVKVNVLDHAAPTLIGRHGIEICFTAVQDTNACGCKHFVSRKGIEFAAEGAYIHALMGHGLCAIDMYGHAVCVRDLHDFPRGIDCAEHIGNVYDGDEFCARGE